jgi:hypothetical protein
MSKKNVMVWAWVDEDIRKLVERISESKGISISEYVRQLVIEDLDRRSVFTTMLKNHLENDAKEGVARK